LPELCDNLITCDCSHLATCIERIPWWHWNIKRQKSNRYNWLNSRPQMCDRILQWYFFQNHLTNAVFICTPRTCNIVYSSKYFVTDELFQGFETIFFYPLVVINIYHSKFHSNDFYQNICVLLRIKFICHNRSPGPKLPEW
jgi:hypothetical protein